MKLYSLQAEMASVGSILIEGTKLFEETLGILEANDFYEPKLKRCFSIFSNLYKEQIPIDLVSVSNYIVEKKLDITIELLVKAQNSVPAITNFNYYAKTVKDYSYKRKVLAELERYRLSDEDKGVEDLVQRICAIPKYEEAKEKSNKDIMLETIADANKGMDFVFPENFRQVNKVIGGLDRGDLVVIGGYPSNGKSSLMTDLTVGFANQENNILIATLEMSPKANMRRIEANMNKINTMKFRTNSLTDLDKEKIKATIPIVNDVWKYNCVRAYTIADIVRAVNKYQPDILFIDYLQNISEPRENLRLYEKATKHTLQIQQLTKEKNITTFLLSQFHRPGEGGIRRPHNKDLRDSGAIEERADVIFLIYWERKLRMERNITKSKDGATGGLNYNFYPEYHRWIDPDDDDKEPIIYKKAREVSGEYYKQKKEEESMLKERGKDNLPF